MHMEITMKLANVIKLNNTIKAIIDNSDIKVEALFKYKLLGILNDLESHINNFEIIRNEKIREYGKETDDGKVEISSKNADAIKKFNNDMISVLNSEITININKLKAEEVFDKGVKAEYLTGLYPIIEG